MSRIAFDLELAKKGIEIPELAPPVANYVPWVKTGNLVYISGQLPMLQGKLQCGGQLGAGVSIEDGQKAARLAALNVISHVRNACDLDLSKVTRVVKIVGFVAATSDFTDHAKVLNAASDLFIEVFGEAGRHARAAVGSSSLPLGACVEIEAVFEIA
jgi:enamine deaminase RidA (YjgF/YER057c/UK114 family)